MTSTNLSDGKSALKHPRSLPVSEWPDADRHAWEEACRPGSRLRPGGVASHLAQVTAAASTAATYGGSTPHLASALLNHTDPRVTEEHYNRASSVSASKIYTRITAGFLHG